MRARALALGLFWTFAARAAVGPAAPAPVAAPPDTATPTCTESFPVGGSTRPHVKETFPAEGKSGQALILDLVLEHGKGETVLPSGTGGQGESDPAKALELAGFRLPNAKGDAAPKLETTITGETARSHLTIPVVALPKKPGRHELLLPPLPVAIARASGEVRTLCTAPHPIVVTDAPPPGAKPKPNAKPLRQREEWTAAKHATIGAAIALALGALILYLVSLWRRRPKPVIPPPPPRAPWVVALEELFDVRIARLVEQGRFAEHFDRVSDALRRYLGARYGFDGLETTTREAMSALRKVTPRIVVLTEIAAFLENADLVKFAKLTPDETECEAALVRAEEIVRRTMPEAETTPGGPPDVPGTVKSPGDPAAERGGTP